MDTNIEFICARHNLRETEDFVRAAFTLMWAKCSFTGDERRGLRLLSGMEFNSAAELIQLLWLCRVGSSTGLAKVIGRAEDAFLTARRLIGKDALDRSRGSDPLRRPCP